MLIGILAALAAALVWAIATRGFQTLSGTFHPISLNIWKGVIALIGVGIWWLLSQSDISALSTNDVIWLLASGVIGIGIGDTALFIALKQLGDRATLLIAETLAPITVLVMGWLWLADYPGYLQILGMALIVLGIDWTIGIPESGHKYRNNPGLKWAILAAFCQALGMVLSRQVLKGTDLDPALTAGIRLFGGLMACLIMLRLWKLPLKPTEIPLRKYLPRIIWVSLLGTLFCLTMVQFSLLHIDAALAQTLIATSALGSVGIAFIYGEKVSRRNVVGVIIGVFGLALAVGAVLT